MNKYKNFDFALILLILFFLIKLIVQYLLLSSILIIIFKIILAAFLFCLFFYEKTKNFKSQLNPKIKHVVSRMESILTPYFKFTNSIIKPYKIGQGVLIDLMQFVVIILILIILIIF